MDAIRNEMLQDAFQPTRHRRLIFSPVPPLGTFLKGYEMSVSNDYKDPATFLEEVKPQIYRILEREIIELQGIKFQLGLVVSLRKDQIKGPPHFTNPTFYHAQVPILNANEIDLQIQFEDIKERIERYTNEGSGWVIDHIEKLYINIANYQPLRGSSYIDLPKYLKDKKAIINVKNKDDNCLRWALRSALFPATKHSDRPSSYPSDDGLNFNGIQTPTPISQIQKVEKLNNLSINVFGFDGKSIIVYQLSKQPADISRINLMLIEKDEKTHYTWIKNFNRLLYDQNKHKEQTHFCE